MNASDTESIQDFYENDYSRSDCVAQTPNNDSFIYGPVLNVLSLELAEGMRVLDLGCNTGSISFYMADRGCRVTGIDLAQNAIETAQRSATHLGIHNVDFMRLDFLQDWQEPAVFDLVFCCHVVEHVPDDAGFVGKIAFSMKPGGKLLIIAPTKYSWFYRINMLLHGKCEFDKSVGHLRRYTTPGLQQVVKSAGLKIKAVSYYDGVLRDSFILPEAMRGFNRLWSRKYVRSVFNTVDTVLARFAFPGGMCVWAEKPHT